MHSPKTPQRVAIIMAGGSGERFWPLSRANRPKQLLCLTHANKSMLQESVERLETVIDREHIYVVTGRHLQQAIQLAEIGIPRENVLAEPCKRDTAGCLCYAAAAMIANYGDPASISMAVITADHRISDPVLFRSTVDASMQLAESEPVLVTHGIVPDRAETGYGYIQVATSDSDQMINGVTFHRAEAFHEKPDPETARAYLDDGRYFWNSGMFFWRLDHFLAELHDARPSMAKTVRTLAEAIANNNDEAVNTAFESLEAISIDYALMESARNVKLAKAEYPWDDVGSWLSLERTGEPDEHGNITIGDPVLVNSKNTIVYNEPGAQHMAVGVVGVDDVVVVVSRDGVLITSKRDSQLVRDVVRQLKDRGSDQI